MSRCSLCNLFRARIQMAALPLGGTSTTSVFKGALFQRSLVTWSWRRYASSASLASLRVEKLPKSEKEYYLPVVKETLPQQYHTVEELIQADETLANPDYFQVHKLFTVRDLYGAKVHLGHKVGGLNPRMTDFVFGSRFNSAIIDLDKTAFHLRQALNFLAHVAFRKGIILFMARSPHIMHMVENLAAECGEYAHCREWDMHTFTNAPRKFGGIVRLPDAIVFVNTLDTVMSQHRAVVDAAKMLIPTVGIVDTNCDPNLITYPIPGNDDSLSSVKLFCSLFKEAILRGKNKRRQIEAQVQKEKENPDESDEK